MASASTPFNPDAFKNMAQYKKHAIRQGLLPATDQDGHHSSEEFSHRLAKDILDIHHTGLFQDFNNWRSIYAPMMPQSQEELDDLLEKYFNTAESSHLSIPSRTNFSKYLQSYYQIANTYRDLQCPTIPVPILQEEICQTLHHANVPTAIAPQRGQHIPLLLGVPPSSQ